MIHPNAQMKLHTETADDTRDKAELVAVPTDRARRPYGIEDLEAAPARAVPPVTVESDQVTPSRSGLMILESIHEKLKAIDVDEAERSFFVESMGLSVDSYNSDLTRLAGALLDFAVMGQDEADQDRRKAFELLADNDIPFSKVEFY